MGLIIEPTHRLHRMYSQLALKVKNLVQQKNASPENYCGPEKHRFLPHSSLGSFSFTQDMDFELL
jgi:hypothetical protein